MGEIITVDKPQQSYHKQVRAKVSAYVDEGLKELIEAINEIDGFWTYESCEGYRGDLSMVWTSYKDVSYNNEIIPEMFEAVKKLADAIYSVYIGDVSIMCNTFTLSIEWTQSMSIPAIIFECNKADIAQYAKLLRTVKERGLV